MRLEPRLLWWALALTLLYRVWLVGHLGITLYLDEAYYWGWAQDLAWGYYSKPPLIAAAIAASTALFGNGVLGVKALSMLTYPVTAWLVYRIGRELFNVRVGVMAGLLWNLSFASGLLGVMATTDAFLLMFWAAALWLTWRLLNAPAWRGFVGLAVVLALGLLSKYTLLALGALVPWLAYDLYRRHGTVPRRYLQGTVLVAGLLALMLWPHLQWSLVHGSPTVQHTVEITVQSQHGGGWSSLLMFWASQLLMISPWPLLYALLSLRGRSQRVASQPVAAARERMFLLVPAAGLLTICSLQAYNATAGMNWAAPAYLSLCLLFAERVDRFAQAGVGSRQPWGAALALNLLLVLLLVHANDLARLAGREGVPAKWDVFVRMRGWDALYRPVLAQVQREGELPLISDHRAPLAQAAYQWAPWPAGVLSWNPTGRVNDHYKLTTRLQDHVGEDMLWVGYEPLPAAVAGRFNGHRLVAEQSVNVAPDRQLRLWVYRLQGFRGYGSPDPA